MRTLIETLEHDELLKQRREAFRNKKKMVLEEEEEDDDYIGQGPKP